jgi:hypothetical protein
MSKTAESRTVSVSINRELHEVYRFLSDPGNFPQWASGLCLSIRQEGDAWVAETHHGEVKVRFTSPNPYGIVDHYVYPAPGGEVYVPMRVGANGSGSEVLLTLFRQPGMSDTKFAEEAGWVERDLQSLRARLEK